MQYTNLFCELVKKGIKLKYRRSYLGVLWSLIEPLLTMIVLTLVFGTLLDHHEASFPVYILAGRLIYGFFSQATTTALKSIRANEGLIKKVYVPKLLFPMSGICFNFILFLISLPVLFAVSLVLKCYPSVRALLIVLPLLTLFLLACGVGVTLSTMGVYFRDLEYLWNIALMLIMYTSAIFYYPDRILDSNVSWLLKFNPLFCVISSARSCIFGEAFDTWEVLYPLGFAVVFLLLGTAVFKRKENEFLLHI
ncbi:MAG: ABC transporter permease [Lachnospiraceae bacterium]|nr:ABC transporter permease [Lachnospiraceae bacterium]